MIYLPGAATFILVKPCIHVMQGIFLMVLILDPAINVMGQLIKGV